MNDELNLQKHVRTTRGSSGKSDMVDYSVEFTSSLLAIIRSRLLWKRYAGGDNVRTLRRESRRYRAAQQALRKRRGSLQTRHEQIRRFGRRFSKVHSIFNKPRFSRLTNLSRSSLPASSTSNRRRFKSWVTLQGVNICTSLSISTYRVGQNKPPTPDSFNKLHFRCPVNSLS